MITPVKVAETFLSKSIFEESFLLVNVIEYFLSPVSELDISLLSIASPSLYSSHNSLLYSLIIMLHIQVYQQKESIELILILVYATIKKAVLTRELPYLILIKTQQGSYSSSSSYHGPYIV